MSALTDRLTGLAQRNAPFLTYYDVATGERTELSGVTTANWVDKTANLIVDGLDLEAGAGVRIAAATHWSTLVWILAAWRTGLVLGDDAADLTIVGPDGGAAATDATVALSFKPFGLPIGTPSPGVIDFHGEVLSYPDAFFALDEPDDATPAVRSGSTTRTHGDLATARSRGRVLVAPGGLARDVDLLAGALASPDGGVVVVAHGTTADHERIAADESL